MGVQHCLILFVIIQFTSFIYDDDDDDDDDVIVMSVSLVRKYLPRMSAHTTVCNYVEYICIYVHLCIYVNNMCVNFTLIHYISLDSQSITYKFIC